MEKEVITLHNHNAVFDKIECDDSIAMELTEYFKFSTPNYEMIKMRNPRLKHWDGSIKLFHLKTHKLYRGLRSRLEKFCSDRRYELNYVDPSSDREFSIHEAKEFIKTLNLPSHIEVRDYQLNAFVHNVRKGRLLTLCPTSSGKSLIIYLTVMYLNVKALIIVPTVGLVQQLLEHFKEYGCDSDGVHLIYSQQEKYSNAQVVISTWQSLMDMPKEYFNQCDAIFVDEAHGAEAKSIKHIMELSTDVYYRFGFTGTLKDVKCHRLTLEGLFGDIYEPIKTHELIEQGYISDLKIKILLLKYSPEDIKAVKGLEYADELTFIVRNEKRRKFINNLILSLKGNTLILFRFVGNQGRELFDELSKLLPKDRPVYFIYGKTELEEREFIRTVLSKETNAVLVGSYGCVGTGLDIPSLKHVIFGHPFKSKIKVLQAIGRGLRKHIDKQYVTVYDIGDDLGQNFTVDHLVERVQIYIKERFKYKTYKINLEE